MTFLYLFIYRFCCKWRRGKTWKNKFTIRPCLHVSVFVWKCNFFSLFSKKFSSTRSVFASFLPVHTYTMNRFENDYLPDCACLTQTCSLLWAREIMNFFGVGLYCCDVFQSRRKSLKCQNQGKNKVKLKGRSNLPLLDTGIESNLIKYCRLLE